MLYSYYKLANERGFEFSGRSSRWEFNAFTCLSILGTVALILISYLVPDNTFFATISILLLGVYWLFSLFAQITVTVRRLHDINLSGFFMALLFVPIVNILLILILMVWPGSEKPNNYGSVHRTASMRGRSTRK